jgi:nucleoid DNA-binding protein
MSLERSLQKGQKAYTVSLQKGEWVYFKNFVSLTRKMRPGRHARHPKTGWTQPRPDVDFNPAKCLLKTRATPHLKRKSKPRP